MASHVDVDGEGERRGSEVGGEEDVELHLGFTTMSDEGGSGM